LPTLQSIVRAGWRDEELIELVLLSGGAGWLEHAVPEVAETR